MHKSSRKKIRLSNNNKNSNSINLDALPNSSALNHLPSEEHNAIINTSFDESGEEQNTHPYQPQQLMEASLISPTDDESFFDPDLSVEDVLSLPSFYHLGREKARELIRVIGVVCEATYSIFSRTNKAGSANENHNHFSSNSPAMRLAAIPVPSPDLPLNNRNRVA